MKILNKVQVKGVIGDPSSVEGALTLPTSVNIKTVNGNSLVGTGDVVITGSSSENLTLTTLTLGNYQIHFDSVSDKLQVIYSG